MKKVYLLMFLASLVLAMFPETSFAWFFGGRTCTVPEPSTLILLGSGIGGLVVYGRKYFKK